MGGKGGKGSRGWLRQRSFPGLDLLGAGLCGAGVAAGYGLQAAGLEPCPFCLLERYILLGLAGTFLLLAVLRPRGVWHWAAGGLLLLPTAAGLAATAQHLRIQAGTVRSPCGETTVNPAFNQGLAIPLESSPASWWAAWLPEAEASCARPELFLGIPLVLWALAAFAAFGGGGVLAHAWAGLRMRLRSPR